jgi:hypothetical protein
MLLPVYQLMYSRGFAHQPPNGRQFGNSLGGSSPEGDLRGSPPFSPPIGPYEFPAPDSNMFIPPWHQPHVVQHVPEQ